MGKIKKVKFFHFILPSQYDYRRASYYGHLKGNLILFYLYIGFIGFKEYVKHMQNLQNLLNVIDDIKWSESFLICYFLLISSAVVDDHALQKCMRHAKSIR